MRSRASAVIILVLCSCIVMATSPAVAQQSLSYPDLVQRMTDLEYLATLPASGERCAQWSSYDRGSQYDDSTGKYVNWEANGDGNGFIREEGESLVLAEMDGPGCLWRIWSALPQKGHLKTYLDGQRQPAVDLPFEEYFTGKTPPFDFPTLSYALEDQGCRGKNLYLPIPYQKSCKIVAEKGWGRYFHFTYSTFPADTTVPTFQSDLSEDDRIALANLDRYFREGLGSDPAGKRDGEQSVTQDVTVPAGEKTTVAELTGPRAITAIRIRMNSDGREDEMSAMRKLVLRARWDDDERLAVWCPLGDFFGTAPGVNHYRSLTTGMTDDGFYALWYMPFAKKAVVELLNEDTVDRAAKIEITHAPLAQPAEGYARFHCKWHRDVFPVSEDRYPDWTLLKTTGAGRFCGVMLHVWNPKGGQYPPAGAGRYWWGEGDEKFFVDGEKFPSTFGTGSEDYFGYAWGSGALFQTPYHCQTMTQDNKGHQSVLRWQVADSVPFAKSFEGAMEKYFPNDWPTRYAATVCWYLSADGEDPHLALPVEERDNYYDRPPRTPGGFKLLSEPPGNVDTQPMGHFTGGTWDKNDQLWWTQAEPGDKLEIALPIKEDGKYKIGAVLTKANDYAIVQPFVNGQKAGPPIDLYNTSVISTDLLPLGEFQLTEGEHNLTIEIVGANEEAKKSYMFGMDRLIIGRMK